METQLLLDMLYENNLESGLKYFYLNKEKDIPEAFFEDFIGCYNKVQAERYDYIKDESILYTVLTILNNKNAFNFIHTLIKINKKTQYNYLYNDIILSRKVTLEEFLSIKDKVKYPHSMLMNLHTSSDDEELILFKYIIKNLHVILDKIKPNLNISYFIIPEILNNDAKYFKRIEKFNDYLVSSKIDRVSLMVIENPFSKYGNSLNSHSKSNYRYKFKDKENLEFDKLLKLERIVFKEASNIYDQTSSNIFKSFERYSHMINIRNNYKEFTGKNKELIHWFQTAVVPFDSYKASLIKANDVNLYLFEFYIKNISDDFKGFTLENISRIFGIYNNYSVSEFKEFSILQHLFGNKLKDKLLDGSVIAKIPLQHLDNTFSEFKNSIFNDEKYINLFDYAIIYSKSGLIDFINQSSEYFTEDILLNICGKIEFKAMEIVQLLDEISSIFSNGTNKYSFNFYLSVVDILMKKESIDCSRFNLKNYFICLPEYEKYFEALRNYGFKKLEK